MGDLKVAPLYSPMDKKRIFSWPENENNIIKLGEHVYHGIMTMFL